MLKEANEVVENFEKKIFFFGLKQNFRKFDEKVFFFFRHKLASYILMLKC